MKLRCLSVIRTAPAALVLVLSGAVVAQDTVWTQRYAGFGPMYSNRARAVAVTPDSTVVVTGWSNGSDGTRDVVTWAYHRVNGAYVWADRWWGGSLSGQEGRAIAVDDSGNIFVAGTDCQTTPDTNFLTIKFDPNGATLWRRTYLNPGVDAAVAVVSDRRGGCYVTGFSNLTGNTNEDILTIHYDDAGNEVRVNRYNGRGDSHDRPAAMLMDDSGYLYVTGYSWTDPTDQYDYLTMKLDTVVRDTVWTRRYDGSAPLAPKADFARGIALDDSQNVYVAGQAGEQGTWYDATCVKYSPSGTEVWVNRFDPGMNGTDGATHVGVDANFNVYCAGWTWDENDWPDYLTYRINQQGGTPTNPWFRSYDGGVEDMDSLTALVVDRRGNTYVTGGSYVFAGDLDMVTFKYNPQGTTIWTATYRNPGSEDDEPAAMTADEYGDLYATGFTYDVPSERYLTIKYTEEDVGAFRIVLPNDSFRIGATVTPQAWVRNYSSLTSKAFPVRFEIGHFYNGSAMSDTIPPRDSALITFSPPWQVLDDAMGTNQVRCFTLLDSDKEIANDTVYGTATGVTVWQRLADIPVGPKNRAVKDGGAIGFATNSLIYAFKGNNTVEFYGYNPVRDSWFTCESIPASGTGGKKKVKAGAQLAGDTSGNVYATKGNNTVEFWKYSTVSGTWTQKDDYPFGTSGKRLKAGAGLAYVPEKNALYGCKANNTVEFYHFDVAGDTWLPRKDVPLGLNGKKPKDGTAMAYDGEGTIYLLKGGTLEFYAYSVARDTWYPRKDIRYSGFSPKRRKVKKGSGMAFDTEFKKLYVLKGSKSGEFWFFDPAADTWVEPAVDSFPTPPGTKPPYAGADLCYGEGKVYAFRGNKTLEFWRFNANFPLGFGSYGQGPQAYSVPLPRLRFSVAPNPFAARTRFRYSLPQAGRVRLVLYDAAGRLVRTVQDGWQSRGEHAAMFASEGLAAGVYVARLHVATEAGVQETTRKLLVSR